ncbi:MAG: hypothetical protein GX591_03755 [Planctomycetes bacterium]|nr:hypothetical protein [Planctomycetota bacterium]
MSAISIQLDNPSFAAMRQERQLRSACNEFIGTVMFGQMLSEARQSVLNDDLFSSPGARVFQSQLDDVLLQQAAGTADGGMFGDLSEALVRSLSRPGSPGGALDVEG